MLKIGALPENLFSSLFAVAFLATCTLNAAITKVPAKNVDELPHVKFHPEEQVLTALNTRPSHAARRLTGDEK